MTVDAIKEAIAGLPEDEKLDLAAWLNALTMDDWDAAIQRDFSPGGKGASLLEKVRSEIRAGSFAKMPNRPRRPE